MADLPKVTEVLDTLQVENVWRWYNKHKTEVDAQLENYDPARFGEPEPPASCLYDYPEFWFRGSWAWFFRQ